MLERHNARTVEVRYLREPGQQKVHIVDATCLEPGECVVVVVMRGSLGHHTMVKRRSKADDEATIKYAIADLKAEAFEAVNVFKNVTFDPFPPNA